jgi:trehalose 6-phosphate synthase
VVIVSNRGPLSFRLDANGDLVATRGAGGLVSGIAPLVVDTDTLWIAAAMTDGDRVAARRGRQEARGFNVRTLDLDPDEYRMAYDVVCNSTLWFLHHHLFDLSRRPRFDRPWREAWRAYRSVNLAFAEAVASEAPSGAVVLVQDYHLLLVGAVLAARRPDLRVVHFSHTPFAAPDLFRVLPDDVATVLLEGMAAHVACGFHAERWARNYVDTSEQLLGVVPRTFVSPLAPDPEALAREASSAAVEAAVAELEAEVGERALLVRVDRIELSKNLLRGFLAFEDLLEHHPEWQGRVVFHALVYPSRGALPEYLAYRSEVETVVARINGRWGGDGWTPVVLDQSDDYPRSLAALRRADVLLVNPIRDGLNLVAKEGPLVNEVDGVLCLSPEAGAWEELGTAALRVDPFDVPGTADVLHEALTMAPAARRARAIDLRAHAGARTPRHWLADQIAVAG